MWGAVDDEEAMRSLALAFEWGLNFVDTAALYGHGHAERLVGRVLKRMKLGGQVCVATKVPPALPIWLPSPHIHASEAFPGEHIRRHTEQSLRNLGVEQLGLQQLHVWSPMWLGEGDWQETFERLREEGKIRGYGVSLHDHDPDSALDLVTSGAVDSVQVIYNLFDQGASKLLFPLCLKHGVGVIVRSPLYEGALSGTFSRHTRFAEGDWRQQFFAGGHLEDVTERAERIKPWVRPPDQTLADLALRFSLSHPAVTTVITGMRRRRHVYANLRVSDGPMLPAEVVRQLACHDWLS
jgi:aryl-alcohol dehydrogenase-like predicted oxidoreductase